MSWTDTLQPASFRGVDFGVFGAGKDFGKRVITHLFPLRDTPFHETMGRAPRGFTIDAFLVGADVIARAKRLETAIEAKGPGRLVHPYYGSLTVEAITGRTDFAAFEGRVARVQITFEEAGTKAAPLGVLNALASLLPRIFEAAEVVLEAVRSAASIAGEPAFVAEGVASDIRAIGSSVSSGLALGGLLGRAGSLGAVVSPIVGRAETIPAALAILAATRPDDLGDGSPAFVLLSRTLLAIAAVEPVPTTGFASDPDPRIAIVDVLIDVSAALTPSIGAAMTAGRLVEASNRDVLSLLCRSSALLAAIKAASGVEWDSRDQLAAYGATILSALDDAADLAGTLGLEDAWRALGDAGAAWAAFVAATSPPLPIVATVVPGATIASSLLAYQLDGDRLADLFDRGGSIARRNAIRHPGFLPGASALEVVGNG